MGKIDQLAEELFVSFQVSIPPARKTVSAKKANHFYEKIGPRLENFYAAAREVRARHGLWMISWARVVLKLQQRLLSAGYPEDVVSKLLFAMLFSSAGTRDKTKLG
jgi:hypothetical protein